MRRTRFALALIARGLSAPLRSLWAWQAEIPDEGRVVLVGLGLLAAGLLAVYPPAAAIVPGTVLTLAGLGWRPIRSRQP